MKNMTATTGTSGIVYTSSSSAVFTEDFALDLYAGSPTGDTEWLKGFGGTYPCLLYTSDAADE